MIPSAIKIGAQVYLRVKAPPSGDPSPRGETNNRKSQFYLADDLSLSQQQDTLLHEVLHMIWDNFPRVDLPSQKDLEETVVSGLSPYLLAALRDNPKLVAFLLER